MKRLKICGINDTAFAVAAARAGVDFLGFIFARKSPRHVAPGEAAEIRRAVTTADLQATKPLFVGVFVEQGVEEILEIAASVPLDVVQLHSPAYGAADVAAVKATGYDVWILDSPDAAIAGAGAVLVDGAAPGAFGGTGCLADWSRIAELKSAGCSVVLAGGIGPGNIASALATAADVIDVNSSLETSPGVKSIPLLDALIAASPSMFRQ